MDWILKLLEMFGGVRYVVNTFWCTVNLGGSPTNPGQASSFQIVTPWGQTQACVTFEEAVIQAFQRHSRFTGKMGNYFNTGTTNGLVTGSQTVPTSANDIVGTDL